APAKTLPELPSVGGRPWGLVRPILEDHFGLPEQAPERLTGAQQEEGSPGEVAANKEFSIREQAFLRSQLDVLPRRLLLPQLTQELDGRWIKVGELCIRANLRREVRPCLGVNPAQSLVRHRHQRVTGTHPIRAAVMPGR